MNSKERHEKRYQRRKLKRQQRRLDVVNSIGTLEDVLTFHDMFKYGEECCKGVMWKQSTQNFHRHLFSRTAVNRRNALNGYKPKSLSKFTVNERGKTRNIEAPHIDDRQVQKTITKKVLYPLYKDRMIYDNGASLKDKGLMFSQKQLDKALRKHQKKHGMRGWVIVADYKGFFPNANRYQVIKNHYEIQDTRLRLILDQLACIGSGDIGLPLGVESSQLEMIHLPSKIDNYMACQMHLQGFGHYMDDYHILVPPDRDPKEILKVFIEQSAKYGITVSEAKTKIVPFGKAFKYCKMKREFKYGRWIKKGNRDSLKRARRKIKMFAKSNTLSKMDIFTAVNSMYAYFDLTSSHSAKLKLQRLFYRLFGYDYRTLLYPIKV